MSILRWLARGGVSVAVLVLLCAAGGDAGASNYSALCPSAASESWIDMSSWLQAGLQARWEVRDAGRTVTQYVNTPGPGFYLSEDSDVIDVVIKGTVQVVNQLNGDGSPVAKTPDDDFVGIGVGMQAPLPSSRLNIDGMLFSWGGHILVGSAGTHQHYTLQKLNGTLPADEVPNHTGGKTGACFWHRFGGTGGASRNSVGCYPVAAMDSDGWKIDTSYPFQVLFSEEVLKVSVGGKEIFSVTQQEAVDKCKDQWDGAARDAGAAEKCGASTNKAWRKGRIAWYNLSQNGVIYGNVRMFKVIPGAEGPVAAEDIYGIMRDPTRTSYLKLTKPDYEGLLANDWSPKLKNLKVRVAPDYTGDPLTQGGGKTTTCKEGSVLEVEEDGSFTFTPKADLVGRSDNEDLHVEECKYAVFDDSLWSVVTLVTFALEPKSLACPPEGCFTLAWEPVDHDHDWYRAIPKEAPFGELYANGSCVRITDWRMLDGGSNGRFKFKGSKIVANHPDRITMAYLDRTLYHMSVAAVDIFGLSAQTMVTVQIPAECELDNKCVCPGGFSCQCLTGFAGPRCEVCDTNRKPIGVNPNCTACADCPQPINTNALMYTGECLYPPGVCDVFCTREHTCSGHGNCSDVDMLAGTCNCDIGWAGPACDTCDTDYYGAPAECKYCRANTTCSSNGVCGMDGKCVCDAPFTGDTCEACLPPHYPAPTCDMSCTRAGNCSGSGECIYNPVLPVPHYCECDLNFQGSYTTNGCNVTCTRDSYCSGHGECTAGLVEFTCQCDSLAKGQSGTFVGARCDECGQDLYPVGVCNMLCTNATCSDNGVCGDDGKCQCFNNDADGHFAGDTCAECVAGYYPAGICTTYCDAVDTCHGRGTCNTGGYCDCDRGFQGLNCSVCDVGFYDSATGLCDLQCEAAGNCTGHGECNYDAALPTCRCFPSWYGADCGTQCTPEICSNRGTCNQTDGACICTPGYTGRRCLDCEKDMYPPGLADTACTVHCNPETTCSGNGKCDWQTGRCFCSPGFDGDNCTDTVVTLTVQVETGCDALVDCNGRGQCLPDGTCQCRAAYSGSACLECALPNMYPPGKDPAACTIYCEAQTNCSGHGRCDWLTGGCFCQPGYLPPNCADLEVNYTQVPVRGITQDEGNDCVFFEIGGMCLGWLLILLIVLVLCCLAVALYLLLCRKKKPQDKSVSHEEQTPMIPEHSNLGDWTGAPMDGFDPLDKPKHDKDPAGSEPDSTGLNLRDLTGPPPKPMPEGGSTDSGDKDALLGGGNGFGPGDMDGMDALGKPAPNSTGNDFGPASMDGMDPLARGAPGNGNGNGNDFGPASMDGMDPLGAAAAAAAGKPAAQRWAAEGLTPEQQEALETGKAAAAVKEVQGAPGVPEGSRQGLAEAGRAVDAANAELQSAAVAALQDGSLPAEARTGLEAALDSAWGPADMAGMDPLARQALDEGKKAALIGAVVAGGGLAAGTSGQLQKALDTWKSADAKAKAAATAGSQDAHMPPPQRAVLSSANGKSPVTTMDPLQRAGAARGHVPVAAAVAVDQLQGEQRVNMQRMLQEHAAANEKLAQQVMEAAGDTAVPAQARQVLQDAVNDNTWGPAADLAGMDPVLRAALAQGQTAAAVQAVLAQPDLPSAVRTQLEGALHDADTRHANLQQVASAALQGLQGEEREALAKALEANQNPWAGFHGDVDLSGMDPLSRAAVSGMVPTAARNVLQTCRSAGLDTAVTQYTAQEAALQQAVRQAVQGGALPAAAVTQLQDALDGKVSFVYGGVDMGGMDPAKGLLAAAVQGALAQGGLGAAAAPLQAALDKLDAQANNLSAAARQATADPSLPQAAKQELQDALYGKARLANYGFTAADIDLNSDEFAPIGHAAAGGLPGLTPDFAKRFDTLLGKSQSPSPSGLGGSPLADTFGHAGLGDATMANMNPLSRNAQDTAPGAGSGLLGGSPDEAPAPPSTDVDLGGTAKGSPLIGTPASETVLL